MRGNVNLILPAPMGFLSAVGKGLGFEAVELLALIQALAGAQTEVWVAAGLVLQSPFALGFLDAVLLSLSVDLILNSWRNPLLVISNNSVT